MPVTGNARQLTFRADNLGKQIDLMLVFTPPAEGKLYSDLYPVCWKVLRFHSSGLSGATVHYSASTAFVSPQKDTDNIVSAYNVESCETGQLCALMTNEKGNNYLTKAAVGSKGVVQCKIQTSTPAEIAFGLFNQDKTTVSPVFKWTGLGIGSTLAVRLTPILRIYAVSDYQASEIIKGDLHSEVKFEKDLMTLSHETTWNIIRDPVSKEIKIVPA
ncbi:hypothetical protein JR316_0011247 [Psilocybe cubensis]|uniref:Uncharacterized protein n=2 Tax=Psilocybe cubensis TaxID=181762 RepID=A0A8H7XSW2_PSICU|nr:hypothetical protein JR316_0011247 [Psilocybe cubensis]KAH9475688.1 hypothetical protein JR316_0011247 [Psilocybe cubensis]